MLNIFSKSPKKTLLAIKIAFRGDIPADVAAHGSIYADCAAKNLKSEPVNFAFLDVSEPPELDPAVLAHIWDQARAQGYNPLRLRSYATVFPVMNPPAARFSPPPKGPQVNKTSSPRT
jgi:hypothetical protein